jgi:hypothetical protein
MPPWILDLFAGWPMIMANLPSFFAVLAFMIGAVWLVVNWAYRSVLASKNGQIELQDRQLADYREKLKGATPEEAKAKIDALEEKVRNAIGDRWKVLTTDETARFVASIAALPHRRIQVMYSNYLGRDLAKNFADAFERAGWTDVAFSEGGGLGYGLSTGRGNGLALTLKSAIEAASGQKVNSIGPAEDGDRSGLFVAVGINSLPPL